MNRVDNNLQENDIKPFDLIAGQEKFIKADRERLLKNKADFVKVGCPACGSADSKFEFDKNGIEYVSCVQCETVYVNPRPTAEILGKCYAQSEVYEYWNKYVFPSTDEARRKGIYRERLERILGLCQKQGMSGNCTLMEIGAGFGSFCDEANKMDFFKRVIAIEPTPEGAKRCREKGLEVIQKPVEQIQLDEIVPDIIVSFEVIEHLFSPEDFFLNCYSLLKKGGMVIISCPNIKGFDNIVLGKNSSSVDHEHLNYFHPKSLATLMNRSGFDVIESLTPGKLDVQLVKNRGVEKGILSLDDQPFLKQILVDGDEDLCREFQVFLADNLLSGHMWMAGVKKEDI